LLAVYDPLQTGTLVFGGNFLHTLQ
jgi:hypothetical protein